MTSHPIAPQTYKRREAYSCLKPEKLPVDVPLAISISPSDKQQYYDKRSRVETFRKQLYGSLLIHVSPYASYELHVEISEAGRLHCHGVITVKDALGFYLYAIPFMRDTMTYEIDTIEDIGTWTAYCTKQAHLFEGGKNPVIRSTKDPLFILNMQKGKSTVTVEKRQYTFDDYVKHFSDDDEIDD